MTFKNVLILLPCESLEDLCLDQTAGDAGQLLNAYTAPFHPAIVAAAKETPRPESAQQPPDVDTIESTLLFLPRLSESLLPDGWAAGAEKAGVAIIRDLDDRDRAVGRALELLDGPPPEIDAEIVADFYALGYCHFVVELVTRQLRYMSSLDEDQFQQHLVDAADAAIRNDTETAREQLQSAFDQLAQAREYFYPNEATFIDLTLAARTTLGKPLAEELSRATSANLLISGEDLQKMSQSEPETFAALKKSLDEGTVALAGGHQADRPLALVPLEAVLFNLRLGLDTHQRLIGQKPKTFGLRRFGLMPMFPQILANLGFEGALHMSFDAGRFPTGNQSRIFWEGCGSLSVESLARAPFDAAKPETFLALPEKLGDAMDLDYGSTLAFAHWPGRACRWYEDLKRMSRYAPVLGQFNDLDHYFEDSYGTSQPGNYSADKYRSPYLQQAVGVGAFDPISRWAKYYRRRAAADAIAGMNLLTQMIAADKTAPTDAIEKLYLEIDAALESNGAAADSSIELDRRIDDLSAQAASDFSDSLPRKDAPPVPGRLAINPRSFPCGLAADTSDGPIAQAQKEVPPMGFVWLGDSDADNLAPPDVANGLSADAASPSTRVLKKFTQWRKTKKGLPPLAEENTLRNEFFEIAFDAATGGIRAIHDYHTRNNRLAQQVALRLPGMNPAASAAGDEEAAYSIMAADEFFIARCDERTAEMCARGRLVDRDVATVARFSQTTRVRRGSRVIELDIEIQPEREPDAGAWDSYYAARFAWHDSTADIFRDVNSTTQPTDTAILESPRFVDVRSEKFHTTILTGGLPFHRRFGLRKLDTLLIVKGELQRRFRLGIGIDLPRPAASAEQFLSPPIIVREAAAPPLNPAGWLFHIDARNVVATAWEPIVEDGLLAGCAVRLLETEGRNTSAHLRCFRPIGMAETADFRGQDRNELAVDNDKIAVDLAAYEFLQLEARWQPKPVTEDDTYDNYD